MRLYREEGLALDLDKVRVIKPQGESLRFYKLFIMAGDSHTLSSWYSPTREACLEEIREILKGHSLEDDFVELNGIFVRKSYVVGYFVRPGYPVKVCLDTIDIFIDLPDMTIREIEEFLTRKLFT